MPINTPLTAGGTPIGNLVGTCNITSFTNQGGQLLANGTVTGTFTTQCNGHGRRATLVQTVYHAHIVGTQEPSSTTPLLLRSAHNLRKPSRKSIGRNRRLRPPTPALCIGRSEASCSWLVD